MVEKKLKQSKCLKTPLMSEGTRNRREIRADYLREKFESNIHPHGQKTVCQNEKYFSLAVPVNLQTDRVYKGKKSDIPDENLPSLTNKMSKKVMEPAAISWYGVIKHFLVNDNGIKVNKDSYCLHLRKEQFLAIEKIVKRDDWILAQDGALSHGSHFAQYFFKTKLKRRFIHAEE